MERELSITTELAIILVGVAAVLGIVSYLIFVGKEIQNSTSGTLQGLEDNLGYDYVLSIANGEIDNEMPAVTAYNILTKYGDIITWSANLTMSNAEVTNTHACRTATAENSPDKTYLCSGIRNLQMHGSDISNKMKGRVQLELIPITYTNPNGTVTNTGTFIAVIHPENSIWKTGVVDSTCENVSWYTTLMAQHNLTHTWRAENKSGCTP